MPRKASSPRTTAEWPNTSRVFDISAPTAAMSRRPRNVVEHDQTPTDAYKANTLPSVQAPQLEITRRAATVAGGRIEHRE